MAKSFALNLIIILVSVFSLGACSNTDNPYLPDNPDIVTAFNNLYPNAQDVDWSKKGVYYVANCRVSGNELDVWFNDNAGWVMTEEDIFRTELPSAVETSFEDGKYSSWVMDNVTLLTFPKSPSTVYLLEVQSGDKEMALFYTPDGTLSLEKSITNADDTIWPDVIDML